MPRQLEVWQQDCFLSVCPTKMTKLSFSSGITFRNGAEQMIPYYSHVLTSPKPHLLYSVSQNLSNGFLVISTNQPWKNWSDSFLHCHQIWGLREVSTLFVSRVHYQKNRKWGKQLVFDLHVKSYWTSIFFTSSIWTSDTKETEGLPCVKHCQRCFILTTTTTGYTDYLHFTTKNQRFSVTE